MHYQYNFELLLIDLGQMSKKSTLFYEYFKIRQKVLSKTRFAPAEKHADLELDLGQKNNEPEAHNDFTAFNQEKKNGR